LPATPLKHRNLLAIRQGTINVIGSTRNTLASVDKPHLSSHPCPLMTSSHEVSVPAWRLETIYGSPKTHMRTGDHRALLSRVQTGSFCFVQAWIWHSSARTGPSCSHTGSAVLVHGDLMCNIFQPASHKDLCYHLSMICANQFGANHSHSFLPMMRHVVLNKTSSDHM